MYTVGKEVLPEVRRLAEGLVCRAASGASGANMKV
jgi:hypothetical protein